MNEPNESLIRGELLDRRSRIQALAAGEARHQAEHLLKQVDEALERLENGCYGRCEICHDMIEEDRLIADPLIRFCLDHLTIEEQSALERDLSLASRIQEQMLPSPTLKVDGWEISHLYQPARIVSGDYCDVVRSEEGDLFFLLGDVSGKGVAASMLMTFLHATFRSFIAMGLPVNQMVERANRIFCESTMAGHYATLVCGRADSTGRVELCIAGHCPPLLIGRAGITAIDGADIPVGIFCSGEYSIRRLTLSPGEGLFLYTDGLSEARSLDDTEYGTERIIELLGENRDLPVERLTDFFRKDLALYQAGAAVADDVTVMAVRRVE